jgi:hypothetical protein
MALIPFIDIPVVSPWQPPGVLSLMDAAKPRAAWTALNQLDVRWVLLRPWEYADYLVSPTGIRLALSLNTTSLIYDEAQFQIFERREQFADDFDLPQVVVEFDTHFADAQLTGTPCAPLQPLFARVIQGPGDFELSIGFSSKGGTLILDEKRNDKWFRTFQLRSWHPYVEGPQRLRFLLRKGESAQFYVSADGGICWNDIGSIVLRRALLAPPVDRASESDQDRTGAVLRLGPAVELSRTTSGMSAVPSWW